MDNFANIQRISEMPTHYAVTDNIGLFTQALNAAFVNAYNTIVEPAPIDFAITEVGSKGKVENYPWMFPPPLLAAWDGYRNYAKLGSVIYRVPNITYTAQFEIPTQDLDDDQVGGFKLQAASMAEGAKVYKGIACLSNLALGQTNKCFDDTAFFATSHTVGTGNNIITGTAAATDGVTHAYAVLLTHNKVVKPLLWQTREVPVLKTDAGTIESEKILMTKWFTTMRGAPAYGFWWDALLVKYANTPTLAEIQTDLGKVKATMRGFKYPTNLPTDTPQYPNEQIQFNKSNTAIVCSTKIEHLLNQAMTLSLISSTENPYRDFASLVCSARMDGVT